MMLTGSSEKLGQLECTDEPKSHYNREMYSKWSKPAFGRAKQDGHRVGVGYMCLYICNGILSMAKDVSSLNKCRWCNGYITKWCSLGKKK